MPRSIFLVLVAIPLAAVVTAWLMRGSTSLRAAITIASFVSLVLNFFLPLMFGHAIRASDTDPVAGMILYVASPLIALAATAGSAYGLARASRQSQAGEPARQLMFMASAGVLLAILSMVVAVAAFILGLQLP